MLGCAPPAPVSAPKQFFHDGAIRKRLASEGQKLVEAGEAAKVDDLVSQIGKKARCRLALAPASRRKLLPSQIYEKRLSGVLAVGILYKCAKCPRWHADVGTGFVITADGTFVTNHHTVESRKGKGHLMVVMTTDGQIYPVKAVLASSALDDVAILRIDGRGHRFHPIPLSTRAPVGSPVTVISHPGNRLYTLTHGIISRYYQEGRKDGSAPKRLTITADFAKGSSGGPLLNECGNAVGLVASTHSLYYDKKDGVPRNLQMVFKQCIPAEAVLTLIENRTEGSQ